MTCIAGCGQHDPDSAPSDAAFQDQLLLALRERPLVLALEVHIRHNPNGGFAAIHEEALLLDREHEVSNSQVTCPSVLNSHTPSNAAQDGVWKEALKREILEEVQAEMRGITQDLLREIKLLFQLGTTAPCRRVAQDWDGEGGPVCCRCRQAEHIARFCWGSQTPPSRL